MSSTNDVILLSVLKAVGNLDQFPGFSALGNKCSKFCSLVGSPSSKSISLCLLEGIKSTGVSGLSGFASLEFFSSVGGEGVSFSFNADSPGASDIIEGLAEGLNSCFADCIHLSSGGSEGNVEAILSVVVVN